MSNKIKASLFGVALVFSTWGTASAEEPKAASATGVPECDAYLATFEKLAKCEKAGPALGGLKAGLEASKAAWATWKTLPAEQAEAAKKAAAPGCKAGEDALKTTAASLGCQL